MDENRIMSVLANMSDGIVVVDTESRILLCNHAAESLLNIEADYLIGRPIEVLQADVEQDPKTLNAPETRWADAITQLDKAPTLDFHFRLKVPERKIEATLFPIGPHSDRLGIGILLRAAGATKDSPSREDKGFRLCPSQTAAVPGRSDRGRTVSRGLRARRKS